MTLQTLPAATSPSSTAGTKRKRSAEPKFYAVRIGAKPGIYHSWPDCFAQVKGFKNATFKSFSTLTDAESFLRNEPSTSVSRMPAVGQKYYAVQNGRTPGVYMDWPSAQQQIVGWPKPRFKSFTSRAEASEFVKEGAVDTTTSPAQDKMKIKAPTNKKQKRNSGGSENLAPAVDHETIAAGYGTLPPGAIDGFDHRIILNPTTGQTEYRTERQQKATKMQATGLAAGGMLNVYTDGSALANGTAGATAGVGVYFGPKDTRNVSEPLLGPRQTNQRAELTAIQRALDHTPRNRDVTIYSDSNYAIKCVTEWFQNWRRNGWMTSSKRPVENKDLVEVIVAKIEERQRSNVKTLFQWVKGHATDPGNIAADQLAVSGAHSART